MVNWPLETVERAQAATKIIAVTAPYGPAPHGPVVLHRLGCGGMELRQERQKQ